MRDCLRCTTETVNRPGFDAETEAIHEATQDNLGVGGHDVVDSGRGL